ncbi:MAG: hypothetical protein BAJALOKI1v1_2560001 [Promethearchaeota archaeon]|nr:MAG: hypothetical protein BAJALOKI1v1_2560001 [Candidatus Lokiarchaeota archaeon]
MNDNLIELSKWEYFQGIIMYRNKIEVPFCQGLDRSNVSMLKWCISNYIKRKEEEDE